MSDTEKTPIRGSYYEGLRLLQDWREQLKARQEIGEKFHAGQQITEEEERMADTVCNRIDDLGAEGTFQLLAHLFVLGDNLRTVIGDIQGELQRHFPEEWARAAADKDPTGEPNPFADGVREVA